MTSPDVESLVPVLRLHARRIVADRDEADRLVEAALRRAIRQPRRCASQSEIETWLLQLLRHEPRGEAARLLQVPLH